jgi:hypothetical protein
MFNVKVLSSVAVAILALVASQPGLAAGGRGGGGGGGGGGGHVGAGGGGGGHVGGGHSAGSRGGASSASTGAHVSSGTGRYGHAGSSSHASHSSSSGSHAETAPSISQAPTAIGASHIHAAGESVRTPSTPGVSPGHYEIARAPARLEVRSLPIPRELARAREVKPERPDEVANVGGNGSPRVAFNRRSVGGSSGVDSIKRDEAYRMVDNRPPANPKLAELIEKGSSGPPEYRKVGEFNNSGPIPLPTTVAGKPATYVKHQPVFEPAKPDTARAVVARHPQDVKAAAADPALKYRATGPGYWSRHYGDRVDGRTNKDGTAPLEGVWRIQ